LRTTWLILGKMQSEALLDRIQTLDAQSFLFKERKELHLFIMT